ncbi:Uncharacterized protein TCM_026209 [Theobroma cacao]|uniref:Uncharacterized protein n=1 Tax=Theobroma cacao TaxID=3641 RepID=A0A061F1K9_THECC|nr:Uncharacterized protein TCM_026209 [Theobroma cacao]
MGGCDGGDGTNSVPGGGGDGGGGGVDGVGGGGGGGEGQILRIGGILKKSLEPITLEDELETASLLAWIV